MNKTDQALIHQFFYQECNALGIPCARKVAKRHICDPYYGRYYGVGSSYNGPVLYHHNTPMALLIPHPKYKKKFVVLVRYCTASDDPAFYHISCSNTTSEFVDEVFRAAPTDTVTPIFLPARIDIDKYLEQRGGVIENKDRLYVAAKDMIEDAVKFMTELLKTGKQGQEASAYKIRYMLNGLWKANEVFAAAAPKRVLQKLSEQFNAPYKNRIANNHLCTSYEDYVDSSRAEHARRTAFSNEIYRLQSQLDRVAWHCGQKTASSFKEYAARQLEILFSELQITEDDAKLLRKNYNKYFPTGDASSVQYLVWSAINQTGKFKNSFYYASSREFDHLFPKKTPDGKKGIVTSRSVELRGASVTVALAFAKRIAADINGDHSELVGKHIGSFNIRSIGNGQIQVGCHTFELEHVKFFAEHFDLSPTAYREKLRSYITDTAPEFVIKLRDKLDELAKYKDDVCEAYRHTDAEVANVDVEGIKKELERLHAQRLAVEDEIRAEHKAVRNAVTKARKEAAKAAKAKKKSSKSVKKAA